MSITIETFFDPSTFTYSYIVWDSRHRTAAVIDPVLDFEPASGSLCTASVELLSDFLERERLEVAWILDTHIHADHLSAMSVLQRRHGGRTVIGARVDSVQEIFGDRFNAEAGFARDGSQFDVLVSDGDELQLGDAKIRVIETPGHTPACVTYVIGQSAFVGDTLFMPDYGTARTDFPGGSAELLYGSIQKILALPVETKLYMCHDYGTAERQDFRNETTVAEQLEHNVQIREGVCREAFVRNRECLDAGLPPPRLLLPSVQFNMRAGNLPPAESNGCQYLKIPVRGA